MPRRVSLWAWLLCALFTFLVAVLGRFQERPFMQFPYFFKYGNLVIISGFCWGLLLAFYVLWESTDIARRITLSSAGIVVVGAVYAVVVPDIVLINTGAVPDTFVSWVFAGLGAVLALVLVAAIWGVTSFVKFAKHRP